MDESIINDIKEIEDRDEVIRLLEEARSAIYEEFKIIFEKLKLVNKEMSIAVLEEEILCMNCILAMVTEHLVKKYKIQNIDIDQFNFINKLIDSVKS
jgi:hypothetical protein